MASKHIPHLTLLTSFIKKKSFPIAVLPVCRQEFSILILQLPICNFLGIFVLLYCFVIEQLVPCIQSFGTKETVPAKQRKVGALFGTVLKLELSEDLTIAPLLSFLPG